MIKKVGGDIMIDSHIHTKVSTDSQMEIEHAIKRARQLNCGLIITEHMDLKYPRHGEFVFDVCDYFHKYSKYRRDNLFLGIEMGLRHDCVEENEDIVKYNDFDYVIGSIHVVNDVDIVDIYEEKYYSGKSKEEAYNEYLEYMLKCLEIYDCFDSLGHIDYISRYARYDDKEIYYEDFSEFIDEILKILINKGKSIEINTRRLKDEKAVDNLLKIYKRYNELGGKYVTIGSDAHRVEDIGKNFDVAKEIIECCQLKPVYFKSRKMEYMDIYR
jgi:histidinol-phosphatase (PHP family)